MFVTEGVSAVRNSDVGVTAMQEIGRTGGIAQDRAQSKGPGVKHSVPRVRHSDVRAFIIVEPFLIRMQCKPGPAGVCRDARRVVVVVPM
jgi:hypothetical protein